MNIRTENWNGHEIRFVEKEPGDWWAIAIDPANALGYKNTRKAVADHVGDCDKDTVTIRDGIPGNPNKTIINEFGIYSLVFSSELKSAKEFQRWVFNMLKTLRQSTGLEGYQIFRMLDKEHQKEAMSKLKAGLNNPVRVDYIKANTIANKTVSSRYGYPKMLKKTDMQPEMLLERQGILEDTVRLMGANDSFKLGLSVSQMVYTKYLSN